MLRGKGLLRYLVSGLQSYMATELLGYRLTGLPLTSGRGVPSDAEAGRPAGLVRHKAQVHLVAVRRDPPRDVGAAEPADQRRRRVAAVSAYRWRPTLA